MMPSRVCDICCRIQKVESSDWKYLDHDGDMVCSIPCMHEWMIRGSFKREDPLKLDGAKCVRLERASSWYYDDLQMYFRSEYEMLVAHVLWDRAISFSYEAVGFQWDTKQLTIDFYIPSYRCFLEVKGKWGASQRSKYKSFRERFPEVHLLVLPWILEESFRETGDISQLKLE